VHILAERYHCTACGECCRGWSVPLLDGEAARFVATAEGLIAPERLRAAVSPARAAGRVVDTLSGPGKSCVALGDDALCRIHATRGPEAKPLACRLFPLTYVATPSQLRVGLSFACPAVVDGDGPLLAESRAELEQLHGAVAATSYLLHVGDEVPLTPAHLLSWPQAERLVDDWTRALRGDGSLVERLCRAGAACALTIAKLDDGAGFEDAWTAALAGRDALVEEALSEPPEVDRLSRALLRTIVDTTAPGGRGRSWRVWGTLAALAGSGGVRVVDGAELVTVARSELARVAPGLGVDGEGLLARWIAADLESLTFFGAACFDLTLAGGLDLLTLSCAAVAVVARAHAACARRAAIAVDDVKRALRQVYAGVHHRAAMPPGFARALGATASLDLLRAEL
jgi:Fe-S-cluster containining protein